MARLARLTLPGYPHHILQRGNNRQTVFACASDYQTFLDLLGEQARTFRVAIHAYVLMDNHFHLLATPEGEDAVPKMMQALGRKYVRYFNDTHQRSGTLWEGRYKSTLLQSDRYLLACMAYMDLNPVRSGARAQAQDYPWSSCGHYLGVRVDKLITAHPLWWQLGNTPFAREAAYAALVQAGISSTQQQHLIDAVVGGWALGEPNFVAELQKKTQRRVSKGAAGRPARAEKTSLK